MNFIWHAILMLSVGFVLLRILGKKTVGEMTGLEIITLLAMASMIGHALPDHSVLKTVITLCIFVSMLLTIQFLSLKFDFIEKWAMGKASLVVKNGEIIPKDLKKLRLTVDQLEAKLREKGISSFADVQSATIEISGELGYELVEQAKPVTIKEFQNIMAPLQQQIAEQNQLLQELKLMHPSLPIIQLTMPVQSPAAPVQPVKANLFDEIIYKKHGMPIQKELD